MQYEVYPQQDNPINFYQEVQFYQRPFIRKQNVWIGNSTHLQSYRLQQQPAAAL